MTYYNNIKIPTRLLKNTILIFLCSVLVAMTFVANAKEKQNPIVVIKTSHGTMKAELYSDKAPVSVKNFLQYVDEKFYDGTIFHRVISSFVIQAGGHDINMQMKPTRPPIKNEAGNGLSNTIGTLSMARKPIPDSATSQFYINVADNSKKLDRQFCPDGVGYAVFGKITDGMDVVNKIKSVPTIRKNGMSDVPENTVVIESIRLQK